MPELNEFRNFFNKNKVDRASLYNKQSSTMLKKDKRIAKYLGTNDTYLIATIYNVLYIYDWAQQKKAREIKRTQEE